MKSRQFKEKAESEVGTQCLGTKKNGRLQSTYLKKCGLLRDCTRYIDK